MSRLERDKPDERKDSKACVRFAFAVIALVSPSSNVLLSGSSQTNFLTHSREVREERVFNFAADLLSGRSEELGLDGVHFEGPIVVVSSVILDNELISRVAELLQEHVFLSAVPFLLQHRLRRFSIEHPAIAEEVLAKELALRGFLSPAEALCLDVFSAMAVLMFYDESAELRRPLQLVRGSEILRYVCGKSDKLLEKIEEGIPELEKFKEEVESGELGVRVEYIEMEGGDERESLKLILSRAGAFCTDFRFFISGLDNPLFGLFPLTTIAAAVVKNLMDEKDGQSWSGWKRGAGRVLRRVLLQQMEEIMETCEHVLLWPGEGDGSGVSGVAALTLRILKTSRKFLGKFLHVLQDFAPSGLL